MDRARQKVKDYLKGIECMCLLLAMKIKYSKRIYMLRYDIKLSYPFPSLSSFVVEITKTQTQLSHTDSMKNVSASIAVMDRMFVLTDHL